MVVKRMCSTICRRRKRKTRKQKIFNNFTICRGKEARDMLFNDEHNNITSLPHRSSYSSPQVSKWGLVQDENTLLQHFCFHKLEQCGFELLQQLSVAVIVIVIVIVIVLWCSFFFPFPSFFCLFFLSISERCAVNPLWGDKELVVQRNNKITSLPNNEPLLVFDTCYILDIQSSKKRAPSSLPNNGSHSWKHRTAKVVFKNPMEGLFVVNLLSMFVLKLFYWRVTMFELEEEQLFVACVIKLLLVGYLTK